ncbi:hypothetical protein GCM10007147_34560 [Nocardiopsis kunsanensis]|uniref:Uncharacterized protein n=1 Tax=Nocardiopsis kunsanensis TaxID=141693 RepID=A0A918XI21_9ACTN|nr:hypothetical protein GCM10007147_34560 [Nocardiopsis kunsanensis]
MEPGRWVPPGVQQVAGAGGTGSSLCGVGVGRSAGAEAIRAEGDPVQGMKGLFTILGFMVGFIVAIAVVATVVSP